MQQRNTRSTTLSAVWEGEMTLSLPKSRVRDPPVKVVSWNILAPCLTSPQRFPNADPQWLPWDVRLPRIMRFLSRTDADVVALQEVEKAQWFDKMEPLITRLGYKAVLQQKKKAKGRKEHPICNATLFKANRFKLAYEMHRSRLLVVGLLDTKDSDNTTSRYKEKKESLSGVWFIGNCHLDATREAEQLNQLKSFFQKFVRECGGYSRRPGKGEIKRSAKPKLVLCGDFNATINSTTYRLLESGEFRAPTGEVLASTCGVKMKSAYKNRWYREPAMTYSACGWYGTLDYLFYSTESLECKKVSEVINDEQRRAHIQQHGLPSEFSPSDHMPVGAIFRAYQPKEPSFEIKARDRRLTNIVENLITEARKTGGARSSTRPPSRCHPPANHRGAEIRGQSLRQNTRLPALPRLAVASPEALKTSQTHVAYLRNINGKTSSEMKKNSSKSSTFTLRPSSPMVQQRVNASGIGRVGSSSGGGVRQQSGPVYFIVATVTLVHTEHPALSHY